MRVHHLNCISTLPRGGALMGGRTRGLRGRLARVASQLAEEWLLQAGQAYFYDAEKDLECPRCTPGRRACRWLIEKDSRARLANQQRLRDLRQRHGEDVRVISSHPVYEFEGAAHCPLIARPALP